MTARHMAHRTCAMGSIGPTVLGESNLRNLEQCAGDSKCTQNINIRGRAVDLGLRISDFRLPHNKNL